MQEIIKVTANPQGEGVVSARELHEFLEVGADFTNWCKRMFAYGFVEGQDYSLAKIGERSAHNKTDYALTIDTAKEISMLQRSPKGKQARQYFIECERQLKQRTAVALPNAKELALMVVRSEEQRERLEKENKKLRRNNTQMASELKRELRRLAARIDEIAVGPAPTVRPKKAIVQENKEWDYVNRYFMPPTEQYHIMKSFLSASDVSKVIEERTGIKFGLRKIGQALIRLTGGQPEILRSKTTIRRGYWVVARRV